MIRTILFAGAIICLVLGPGYMIYVIKFSGAQVFTKRMYVKNMSAVSIGGVTTSVKSKEKWHEPVHFSLSEDMNLISITAKAEYFNTNRRNHYPTTNFIARLSKDQDLVWAKKFSVGIKKKKQNNASWGTKSKILQQFSVSGTNEYALHLRRGHRKELTVKSIEIEVRKNTLILKLWLLIAGFILAFISISGVLMMRRKAT